MGPREKGWEEHTVASLDSALNSWFDSVPDHREYIFKVVFFSLILILLCSSLGSPAGESDILRSVRGLARRVLLYSDHNPSAIHPFVPEGGLLVFPCARNLRECCSCL
jgi:hypothetical protein